MSTTHRTPPLMVGDPYAGLGRGVAEAAPDLAELESEAEDLGLLPETIPLLPEDPPELTEEEKEKVIARENMNRELLRQARERHNKRGSKLKVKNGKAGRIIGMWFSYETIDALNALSVSWEMARTSVVTQLIRQNKGAVLKRWIGPVEGELEKEAKMKRAEDHVHLHERKL